MSDRRWNKKLPRPLDDLAREMEGLFERFMEPSATTPNASEVFAPPVNVAEADDHYEVTVDLPGLKPQDVRVEILEGNLVISGQRVWTKDESKNYHRVERGFGQFRRQLSLPGRVDEDRVVAQFIDGVLHVTLPKSAAHLARRIEIH